MPATQVEKFTAKPEFKDAVSQALLETQALTLKEAGNLAARLYQDNTDPNIFFIYTRWEDEVSLDHQQTLIHRKVLNELEQEALAVPTECFHLTDTQPVPVTPIKADDSDPKFNIFFIFKISLENRAALLTQFEEHIKQTRREAGCLLFDLYEVQGQEDTLVVYEHWRQESDVWDIHFHQPYAFTTGQLMEQSVIGDMQQYMNFVTQIA